MTNLNQPALEKICPRCDERFACGGNACWCAQVKLSAATLERLRAEHVDCLCRACLLELSAEDERR